MTDPTSIFPDPASEAPQSFEDALHQLEDLVARLESDEVPLEESLTAFERGQRLLRYCEAKLARAEQVFKQLARDAEGRLSAEGESPGES